MEERNKDMEWLNAFWNATELPDHAFREKFLRFADGRAETFRFRRDMHAGTFLEFSSCLIDEMSETNPEFAHAARKNMHAAEGFLRTWFDILLNLETPGDEILLCRNILRRIFRGSVFHPADVSPDDLVKDVQTLLDAPSPRDRILRETALAAGRTKTEDNA